MAPRVTNVRVGEGEAAKPAASVTTPETAKNPTLKPDANGIVYVTDEKKRKIGLRKLKPSERFNLSEVIEAKTMSANLQLITAATVVSIDQEGCPALRSRADLLNRLDEIGDEGLAAIMPSVLEMYGLAFDEEAISAAKN